MMVREDDKTPDTPILVRFNIGDIHFSRRAALELRDKLTKILDYLKHKEAQR